MSQPHGVVVILAAGTGREKDNSNDRVDVRGERLLVGTIVCVV